MDYSRKSHANNPNSLAYVRNSLAYRLTSSRSRHIDNKFQKQLGFASSYLPFIINLTLNKRAWEALFRSLILIDAARHPRGLGPGHPRPEYVVSGGSSSPFRGGGVATNGVRREGVPGTKAPSTPNGKCSRVQCMRARPEAGSLMHFAPQRTRSLLGWLPPDLPAYWHARSARAGERSEPKRVHFGGRFDGKSGAKKQLKGGGFRLQKLT